MKYYTLFFSLVICAFILYFEVGRSQKISIEPFEGTIVYSIEYLELPNDVENFESTLPEEMKMSISGDMVKIEKKVVGGNQIILIDNEKKESHVLIDMMGQQLDFLISSDDINSAEEEAPETNIEELKGSKTILGFQCKKAQIRNMESGNTQTFFYTKKLEIKHKDFMDLDGFPLQYLTSQQGMKLRMTATHIESRRLSPSYFEVPSGYERIPWMSSVR
jgi:hypothetical protein